MAANRTQSPEGDLDQVARFRTELRRFLHRTEEATNAEGLTPQRYDLLLMIRSAPAERTTVGELCGTLDLSQQAVTELVKRAVTAGLVRRSPSPDDGRVFFVTLTDEGAQRFERAFVALAAARGELGETLGQLQRAAIGSH